MTTQARDNAYAAMTACQDSGAAAVNGLAAMQRMRDKRVFAAVMDRHNIPHPEILSTAGTLPVIIKPATGAKGSRVVFCATSAEAEAAMQAGGPDMIMQTYVSGAIMRVIATPDRALVAYTKDGDGPVLNLARGCAATRVAEVPKPVAALACHAVRACEATIAGVDMIICDNGDVCVLEANNSFRVPTEFPDALPLIGQAMLDAVASR
jgi:glutathione synthase/RimK-type ligase-like ATP-grasp enzyme